MGLVVGVTVLTTALDLQEYLNLVIGASLLVLLLVMLFLLMQLWASCLLAKTYMEMVQDMLNDNDDRALVDFIWERRRETWVSKREGGTA